MGTGVTLYKYGIIYKGVIYGWREKKLYKLPYCKGGRCYKLKEISFYLYKRTLICNLQRDKLTITRLRELTEVINIRIQDNMIGDCPF